MHRLKEWIPNALSMGRLGIALALFALAAIPAQHSLLTAQILAVIGVLSDKLDGTLARMWKTESDLGKRLESFADPLFGFAVGVYIFFQVGLPSVFVNAALIYLLIGSVGRLIIAFVTRELFYEKSQITRVGVGITFVLLLMYLFSIPYKEWVMWFMVFYGGVMCLNYVRMEIQFVMKRRGAKLLPGTISSRESGPEVQK